MISVLFVLFLFDIAFSSTHATDDLPRSHLERYEGVKYLTYTKLNKNSPVDIRSANFHDNYTTVFVIHGFEEKNLDKCRKVKNDIFQFNLNVTQVIIVSWLEYSRGSAFETLFKAPVAYLKVVHQHVPLLARDLYEKILYIRQEGALGAIQLVGYSIGAHVAGQTGRLLQRNDRYTLDQILGLDPAGDYFSEHLDRALRNGDAKKVVVLHTNINKYGFGARIGPNDKIVNGGEKQPNCKIDIDKCSHYGAWNALSLYETSRLGINYEADGVRKTYRPVKPFNESIPATITFSGSEEVIPFTVDNTNGTNAGFIVTSHDLHTFDVKLMSPNGDQFSSSSFEYFSDDLAEKGFRIPHAEPGQWRMTVVKFTKRRSRSTISVIANSRQADTSGIVLRAVISDRTLVYPKPVTVTAELKFGVLPIIYAEVYAYIRAPQMEPIRLPLYDNGIYPDDLANDGIYTNDIIRLPKPERYTVSVEALSNDTAMSPPKDVNFLLKDVINCKTKEDNCTQMIQFEKEAEVGSVKLASIAGSDKIPPRPVTDLRGVIGNAGKQIISLEWTSPRNELFGIEIKRYDIRVLVNGMDFEKGVKIENLPIIKGSLNAIRNGTKNVNISIQIPKDEWDFAVEENLTLKFALKSIGDNDVLSALSNIATVPIYTEVSIIEYYLKRDCKTINSSQREYTVEFC